MTEFLRQHISCPCGSSSDAFCLRHDGSGFCFSCYKNFLEKDLDEVQMIEGDVTYDYVGHRGISRKIFEFYKTQSKLVNGKPFEVAFPFGDESLKVRQIDKVNGKIIAKCIGPFAQAGLFGQDRFDDGSKEAILITEGEYDSLAAYEMLKGRFACESLKSGAGSAYRDLVASYDHVNSFSKIYICFDNDEKGRQAVRAIQGLFDFNKVYLVNLSKFKDANDYLLNDHADDFERVVKSAKRFAPDNIISSFSDIEKSLDESKEDELGTYPFPDLNDKLYGLHGGEVIVVKAPEGVGKTEFFRALEHHLLKTTNHPIGIIHLEEDNGTTVKAIAGYELEVPATLPDCGLSKQDILSGYRRAVRDDEGRIHIHSSFDVEDEGSFLGNIRFLVSAAGCRFIFLDHITWLATGMQDDDERKKLDRISQKLKLLAKELRFCLVEISHVNDDGKTRGSRNITKVGNTVISLDRDLLAGDNRITFLIEKARLGGRTGPAGCAFFNQETGKLTSENPNVILMTEE